MCGNTQIGTASSSKRIRASFWVSLNLSLGFLEDQSREDILLNPDEKVTSEVFAQVAPLSVLTHESSCFVGVKSLDLDTDKWSAVEKFGAPSAL